MNTNSKNKKVSPAFNDFFLSAFNIFIVLYFLMFFISCLLFVR